MSDSDIPDEKREYQITIVRIDDFPKPSTNSEMITRIAGGKQVFTLTNARADELRTYIGKTLSRKEFVKLWLRPEVPPRVALDLLDDFFRPN